MVHSVFLTTPRNFYPFQVIRNKIVRYQDQTVFLEYSCFSFSPRHFVIMNSCPELSILLNFAIIQTWLFYKSMNFISVYCDNNEISLTFLWWRQLRALNNRITTKLLLHCKMFNFSLKPHLHEQFLYGTFYVAIFIWPCRWWKMTNFYVTNAFAEKLARWFLCGK